MQQITQLVVSVREFCFCYVLRTVRVYKFYLSHSVSDNWFVHCFAKNFCAGRELITRFFGENLQMDAVTSDDRVYRTEFRNSPFSVKKFGVSKLRTTVCPFL